MCLHKWSFERDISREYLNQSKFMVFGVQYNEELYTVKKNWPVSYMWVKRLQWAGHVVRMFVNRIPKWILEGNFRGQPATKPRNGWEAKVWKNAKKFLNTKNWHAATRHSSDWRKKTGESMARKWAEETKKEREGGGGKGPPLPLPYIQKFNCCIEISSSLQILPFKSCKKCGLFREMIIIAWIQIWRPHVSATLWPQQK